jgi:hypothetical protein
MNLKNIFIFNKNNSLPKCLLNYINNDDNKDDNKERIKVTLYKELNKHLYLYANNINKELNYELIKSSVLQNISNIYFDTINNVDLIISRLNNNLEVCINDNKKIAKINYLYFIWFVEDFNGNITIGNNIIINPKAGQFIIFPISFVFPVKLSNKDDKTKIIYGWVYKKFKEIILK